jgi:hypothetical protein
MNFHRRVLISIAACAIETQALTGDARRQFMSNCLKGS